MNKMFINQLFMSSFLYIYQCFTHANLEILCDWLKKYKYSNKQNFNQSSFMYNLGPISLVSFWGDSWGLILNCVKRKRTKRQIILRYHIEYLWLKLKWLKQLTPKHFHSCPTCIIKWITRFVSLDNPIKN